MVDESCDVWRIQRVGFGAVMCWFGSIRRHSVPRWPWHGLAPPKRELRVLGRRPIARE